MRNALENVSMDYKLWLEKSFVSKTNIDPSRFSLTQLLDNRSMLPVTVVHTNQVAVQWVNFIYVHPNQSFEDTDSLWSFLERFALPLVSDTLYSIVFSVSDQSPDVATALQFISRIAVERQYKSYTSVAMSKDLADVSEELSVELPDCIHQVETVTDAQTMRDYINIVAIAWEEVPTQEYLEFNSQVELDNPDLIRFVARDKSNQVIATAALILNPETDSSFLNEICVARTHQRQGVGHYLTHLLLTEAKRRGCRFCTLNATEKGKTLYEKFGFVEVGSIIYLYN